MSRRKYKASYGQQNISIYSLSHSLSNYLSIYLGENLVISGCRGGNIKLWSTESCSLVGEMKGNFGNLRNKTMDDNQRCCRLF